MSVENKLWLCVLSGFLIWGDQNNGAKRFLVLADSVDVVNANGSINNKTRNEFTSSDSTHVKKYPHIILIIADDLGFNDVSFHGSPQIPTPNLDALAFSGIILNQYYVSPICTPSRSSLFTGKHPIHTGMQHNVIYGTTPYGLSLDEKLLPEYLKELNYRTHLVGKWHLGHFRRAYTPTCRGFDSHFGHWTGHKDYYDNMAEESNPQAWGYDTRRNFEVSYDHWGKYTTDIYTEEAVSIINNHSRYFAVGNETNQQTSQPLFLTLSHTAVHSANPYKLLQAPREELAKFSHIKDIARRTYAAMVSKLDASVGKIVKVLGDLKMLQDSIIIFTTDNGGPAAGFNGNAASNWPLRGVKNTLYEGGVRGASFIWSPLLKSKSRVSNQMMHIQDWLPTIMAALGEDIQQNSTTTATGRKLDGLNIWDAFNSPQLPSPRTEFLHNIDESYGNEGLRFREWKLLHGTTYDGKWDDWYGPSGFEPDTRSRSLGQNVSFHENSSNTVTVSDPVGYDEEYDETTEKDTDGDTGDLSIDEDLAIIINTGKYSYLENSDAGRAIRNLDFNLWPNNSVLTSLQAQAHVSCDNDEQVNMEIEMEIETQRTPCNLKSGEYCLFNVVMDPCERNNLAKTMPDLVKELTEHLDEYKRSAVPPRNQGKDPRGQPKFWNYTWTNWFDFLEPESVAEPHQLSFTNNGKELSCM